MLPDLNEKDVHLDSLAQRASEDPAFLARLVQGLSDRQERVGYNCLRALLLLAEENPLLLYSYWEVFVELLRSQNTYFKLRGANLIAAVVSVDRENRFEDVFDDYYDLLDGKSVIAACYIAGNSGRIARAKPHLQARITTRLLSIDNTHHPPGRRDLIKGHAVEAFGEYAEQSEDRSKILEFVRAQLESESPRTRKKARDFLQRWGDTG
jgi:truncated hemoglobin YjbI